nr:Chain A, Flagelliform fibroin [Araneus ventricosus]7VU7_B Chain B, Flagelliform fibroin [Araneus ventricosus]
GGQPSGGVLPGGSYTPAAGGSSRLPSLINGIMSSMQGGGFNYQNFGNVLSQFATGTGTCNSNDLNLLMDALLSALHTLSYQGMGTVPSYPSPSAMSAYSQSVRRCFGY